MPVAPPAAAIALAPGIAGNPGEETAGMVALSTAQLLTFITAAIAECPETEPYAAGVLWLDSGVLTLSVGLPVSISVQPTNQSAYDGGTATFSLTAVNATGYQWQKQEGGAGAWADVSGATSASYTTGTLAEGTDNGDKYRCNVSNPAGSVTSSEVTLTVTFELPSGAKGAWYAKNYVATPRPYIPNSIASGGTPVNLFNGSRRQLNNAVFWPARNNMTLTDEAVADPAGNTTAATMVASSTGWNMSRTITLPAGTYTLAVNAKRNGGSDETFKFLEPTSTSAVKTATSSWQRFTHTFTASGSSGQIGLTNNSTAASLQIANLELYSGSSDLGPEPTEVGHMYLGRGSVPVAHSYSGGVLDLSASASFGYIQFPTNISPTNSTVIGLVRKKTASSGYVALMSRIQNWQHYDAAIEDNLVPQFKVGNNMTLSSQQYSAGWNLTSKGWSTFAFRCDGNTRDVFMDYGKLLTATNAISATSARDFYVSTIIDSAYGQGYEWAALAYYDRSLSDAEVLTAQRVLLAEAGVTRGAKRFLLAAGDSISNGTTAYPYLYLSNDSPEVLFTAYTIVGGTMSQIGPLIADAVPSDKPSGAKYIVSFMVTNGLTDPVSTYLTDLQAICTNLRNRGAIVVLCTLPPRADAAHNVRRNTVNAAIATYVGTYCDAICDFAADPTYGTDAAGSNTSYYPDGVHPTTTLQSVWLEPTYRAVINAL